MSLVFSGTNGVTFPDSSLQAAAASPYVLKNRLINGGFQVSQRGTTINSINADYTYTADRWFTTRGGSVNYTQGTTSPPTGFQYYGSYINQTAANPFITIQQAIESTNTYDLLGQTVTLSAWIKAAANTAQSTSIIVTYGYSTTANTKAYSVLATGTTFTISSSAWTKCSITFTVPSNGLTITPVFYNSGSFAVGDGYLITGVQLELGSTATPFEQRLYNQELANCQRYYYRISGATTDRIALGHNSLTTAAISTSQFPVTLRTAPTALEQSGTAAHYDVQHANTATTCSSVPTFLTASINMASSIFTVASGLTAGQGSNARLASTSGYLAWSAEL